MTPKFSILIPTWNNLEFLKLCIRSIRENSTFEHQIIVHVNEGSDGTLEWVKEQGLAHRHTPENVGVCWALNGLRPLVEADYILYMNDDMYALPDWDGALWREIERLDTKLFFLSGTLIQPRPFYCRSVIAPGDYGQSVETFREQDLLKEYLTLPHHDWKGATWPPNVVHRDVWDLVGGYSIEFSPGMYSDPDFSAKLYMAGVRDFRGISASRVYHFEARSTGRVKKNNGSRQFLYKWGITSSTFMNLILQRGDHLTDLPDTNAIKRNITRSKLKRVLESAKSLGHARGLWQEGAATVLFCKKGPKNF